MDNISFEEPIFVGDLLLLEAKVNYVGTTSMEVGVKVSVEHRYTAHATQVTRAYLTFVALDEARRPTRVPRLRCVSAEDRRRWEHGRLRMEARKELWKKLEASR
jgi:acyl-CoA hydrolase